MEDFFDRLDKYMSYSNLNDNKLTVRADLSVGSLGKQRKGSRGLSSESIAKILCCCADLNAEWLLTGKGEMVKNENCRSPEAGSSLFEKLLESKEETIQAQKSQIKLLEEQVEDLKGELLTFESARSSAPTQASEGSGGIPKQTTRGRA